VTGMNTSNEKQKTCMPQVKYRVILNFVGVSVAYNFQTRNNKIKLLTEYESVTQKSLIPLESILQNTKQLLFSSICGVTVSIAATILSFSSSREVTGVL
jgi:dynactin complex subunit